jgi:DNA-binding FadR family transcriptional regulator
MSSGLPAIIFDQIRNDIINEIYPIGSKLPPERELAGKYGASRFAVREAIARLMQTGFVETHPQSGSYVRDFYRDGSLDTLVQTLRVRRVIDRQTLDSLLRFRFTTETNAAAEAALRITDSDIGYLASNLKTKKKHLTAIQILAECDYDFHYKIITIAENVINRLIFQSFKPIYSFFTEFFYSLPDTPENSLKLNLKLLETLKKRNPQASCSAMAEILKYGEKKVYKAIKDSDQLIVIRERDSARTGENKTI